MNKSRQKVTKSHKISYKTKESYLYEDLSMVQSIRLGLNENKFMLKDKSDF